MFKNRNWNIEPKKHVFQGPTSSDYPARNHFYPTFIHCLVQDKRVGFCSFRGTLVQNIKKTVFCKSGYELLPGSLVPSRSMSDSGKMFNPDSIPILSHHVGCLKLFAWCCAHQQKVKNILLSAETWRFALFNCVFSFCRSSSARSTAFSAGRSFPGRMRSSRASTATMFKERPKV